MKSIDFYCKRHILAWKHVDWAILRECPLRGLTPRAEREKSQKVSDSHRNDVSPLTQGLRYRAVCEVFTLFLVRPRGRVLRWIESRVSRIKTRVPSFKTRVSSLRSWVSSIKTLLSSFNWISRKHRVCSCRLLDTRVIETRDSNFSNPPLGLYSCSLKE